MIISNSSPLSELAQPRIRLEPRSEVPTNKVESKPHNDTHKNNLDNARLPGRLGIWLSHYSDQHNQRNARKHGRHREKTLLLDDCGGLVSGSFVGVSGRLVGDVVGSLFGKLVGDAAGVLVGGSGSTRFACEIDARPDKNSFQTGLGLSSSGELGCW